MGVTVLGANGKIGRNLMACARVAQLGWRAQARTGQADIIWSGDMAQSSAVFERGGTIINMIGHTGTDAALLHDVNVRFVEDMLVQAASAGVAHVILASTAAVYGNAGLAPLDEETSLHPTSPYGRSKAMMEDVARNFAANPHSPAITILRIGNVAGCDALMAAAQHHVAVKTAMPLHYFANGATLQRSYIGPRDLFRAIKGLATPHADGLRVFNVVHPQPVGLDGLLAGYRAHVVPAREWVRTPAPTGTIPSVTLCTRRLQSQVTFEHFENPADAFTAQVAEVLSL